MLEVLGRLFLLSLLSIGFVSRVFGATPASVVPSLKNVPASNGIDPAEADVFWEKWHLVTSRYRLDTLQTRLVYANAVAWDAMVKRLPKYPDGAMFAKAIFQSEKDPIFAASVVPKVFAEVEFMKKNSKAYPQSEGWGFADYLYSPQENKLHALNPEIAKNLQPNCFACHAIVKERDYVFAVPAFLQWYVNDPAVDGALFENQFVNVAVHDLPGLSQQLVQRYAGKASKTVKYLRTQSLLVGEGMALVPLADFTVKENAAHLETSEVPATTFVLTVPTQTRPKAAEGQSKCVRFAMSVPAQPWNIAEGFVCGAKVFQEHIGKAWYWKTGTE